MLRKPIVRNFDLYYVCCYIYICTVLYVSIIILYVMELLQIKFGIFEYTREATILQVETKSIPEGLLFTRLVVLRLNVPVNNFSVTVYKG